jgi:hypothetical protein
MNFIGEAAAFFLESELLSKERRRWKFNSVLTKNGVTFEIL